MDRIERKTKKIQDYETFLASAKARYDLPTLMGVRLVPGVRITEDCISPPFSRCHGAADVRFSYELRSRELLDQIGA